MGYQWTIHYNIILLSWLAFSIKWRWLLQFNTRCYQWTIHYNIKLLSCLAFCIKWRWVWQFKTGCYQWTIHYNIMMLSCLALSVTHSWVWAVKHTVLLMKNDIILLPCFCFVPAIMNNTSCLPIIPNLFVIYAAWIIQSQYNTKKHVYGKRRAPPGCVFISTAAQMARCFILVIYVTFSDSLVWLYYTRLLRNDYTKNSNNCLVCMLRQRRDRTWDECEASLYETR